MQTLPFARQIEVLSERLKGGLPGPAAHMNMAPGDRFPTEMISVEGKSCRKASVLALLFPLEKETGVILTKRRAHLNQHAGQISFPGGRQESEETLEDAALRETEEETGISSSHITILGPLSPIYISVSNFCVYPFVGALSDRPASFSPQDQEVERIIEMPLALLGDARVKKTETWDFSGKKRQIPFFGLDGETIWGATAMILSELLQIYTTEQP